MITKFVLKSNSNGVDMVIANGEDLMNINRILEGEKVGTLFKNTDIQIYQCYLNKSVILLYFQCNI